jgi:hypothetical protein
MSLLRQGLVSASPARPCDDMNGLNASLCQAVCDAAHFLRGPADQGLGGLVPRRLVFGGVGLLA